VVPERTSEQVRDRSKPSPVATFKSVQVRSFTPNDIALPDDAHMITVSKSSAKAARRGRTGQDALAHTYSSSTPSEIPRQTNTELIRVHTQEVHFRGSPSPGDHPRRGAGVDGAPRRCTMVFGRH
jgi:hypothetical protein